MKRKNIFILISSLLTLAAMASMLIVLMIVARRDFPKNIKVREDGVTEGIFTVRDLQLSPAQSRKYEVDLVCVASGDYNITIDYAEIFNGGMKHHVDVAGKANGETLYKGKLSKLIDGEETVSFDGVLKEKEPLTVTFVYMMPYETGNEAQGTSADFDVCFKIQKI